MKRCLAVLLMAILLLSACAVKQSPPADTAAPSVTATVPATAAPPQEDALATVITASDFQSDGTFTVFRLLLEQAAGAGVPTPDCAIFGGDYSIPTETDPDNSIRRISDTLTAVYPDFGLKNALFIQGNHDNAAEVLAETGAHDFGCFVVYSINEDDFPSGQSPEQVEQTLAELDGFLSGMVKRKDFRPVIVASHLPLHDSARADNACGGMLAELLNRHGHELDIVYLFGHNHSDHYDDSIGGSVNYAAKGETLYVPVPAQSDSGRIDSSTKLTLAFTYLNYGYVGYSNNNAAGISTNVLTLGVIALYPESIEITRYTAEGEYCRYSIPLQNTQTAQNAA